MLTVVGLGPAGPEHVSTAALSAIEEADRVILRTARHPAATVVTECGKDWESFDRVYEEGDAFSAVYERIVAELCAAARDAAVCYAVPGSPFVAERTVELLRARAAAGVLELFLVPALSYIDLAWERLAVDPVEAGVRLVDASAFAVAAAGGGPLLVSQAWSVRHLSEMKLALEEPQAGDVAVLLHHLGLADEVVVTVPWHELDRRLEPDHLTSVYVPALSAPPAGAFAELDETVARLRLECPWDRAQTHRSLLRHLLEEAYEAVEAIEELPEDASTAGGVLAAHLEEELGDLLAQVVFHSRLATEEGLFTLSDVASGLTAKLVARHPHVFGDAVAHTAAEVAENWERAKDVTKRRSHLFEGIPAAAPALARAEKAERKLHSAGLGWAATGGEGDELAGVAARLLAGNDEDGLEAAGEALLLLARRLASAGVDPEAALRGALTRLSARVGALEAEAVREGLRLSEWVERHGVPPLHQPLC